MSDFWIYFEVGMRHVLNLFSYDHVLFLIALSVPYVFKDWKKVLLLVSLFTVGHTLALLLSVYEIIVVKVDIIEFLIPITILITAFFHLFTAGKSAKNESISVIGVITLFFGIIHGLGFATYFKSIIGGASDSKLLPQTLFRFSKRDWTLVMSSFVIGVVLPMIIESKIWIR